MRKLKYQLDRKSLETIYTAFIRPLLEYGSVTRENCTQYEKQELEKIQTEVARIATDTTKLISSQSLYNETKWDSLEKRRNDHKLSLFQDDEQSGSFISFLVNSSNCQQPLSIQFT